MTLRNKRVFISGGAGVIGKELVRKLSQSNSILFVGDLKTKPQDFPTNVSYRLGDLNTLKKSEIKDFNPEIFIHLAASFERSVESYEFWDENFENNIRLGHHLLSCIKDLKSLQKIIFASSYLVYDSNQYLSTTPPVTPVNLDENSHLQPRNLTGSAKLMLEAELEFLNYYKKDQISITIARIFRGYGQDSRDIISRWIRNLVNNEEIEIFNSQSLFDFIYSKDTAEALKRLAESNSVHGILNLGSGKARSIDDVLTVLRKHFPNMNSKQIQTDSKFEASQASIARIESQINWEPKYSLENAIPEIIEFEKSRPFSTHSIDAPNVLITSSSKKIPLIRSMEKALSRISGGGKVFAGDSSENIISRYVSNFFWKMPPISSDFTKEIIDGCLDRKINLIFPTRDTELLYWARNKSFFSEFGIHVVVSPEESLRICIDKLLFFEFGLKHAFNVIPTFLDPSRVKSSEFVVKPRFGSGSNNVRVKVSKEVAIKSSSLLSDPIFQPFIDGIEISVDAWLDRQNKVKGLVLRRRRLVIDGESQVTETFQDSEIENLVISFLEKIGLVGPVVLQLILDSDRQVHFLECNPRFGGASTTSLEVGLDSFYWSVLEFLNLDLSKISFTRSNDEVRLTRIPLDIFTFYDSNI
jgi:carbamoyl-phosphate synthase large subunit